MTKVPKKDKKATDILFARGVTEENIKFIKGEVDRLGYSSVGDYLNALFDLQREEIGKKRRKSG